MPGLLGHRVADLLAAVTGVDDPEAGDAVNPLVAVHIVEHAALAALEDVQALLLGEFDVVGAVNPDVFERFPLDRIIVCDGVCARHVLRLLWRYLRLR